MKYLTQEADRTICTCKNKVAKQTTHVKALANLFFGHSALSRNVHLYVKHIEVHFIFYATE